MAAATGRDGNDIERSVHWFGKESADAYRQAGATMLTTAIAPHPITGLRLQHLGDNAGLA